MSDKVAILTSVHAAFDTRIFHKQARSLVEAGYNAILIVPHEKDEIVDNVKIINLPRPSNRLQRMVGLTFQILRKALKERAEVYHLHDPELLPVGLLLKLFTRAKVVYDVHENVRKQILNKAWLPVFCRRGVACAYVLFEAIALRFVDHVIIAEDSYMENYENYHNLSAIRNYPIVEYSQMPKARIPGYHTEPRILIYAGLIAEIRGALELIESLRILISSGYNDIHLKLLGVITPDFRHKLRQIVERRKLTSHITIPGEINHKEVFGELLKSHVGLAVLRPDPNYVESLPTKLFEYMSVGLPVIASNFPLWREVVTGNNCGLAVDPMDPEDIARAIRYLLDRPELMEKMGQNGQKAVLEKYSWEHEAEKLLDLYKRLLNGSRR